MGNFNITAVPRTHHVVPRPSKTNRTIRVIFVPYKPGVFNECDSFPAFTRCKLPGFCVEMMRTITRYLHLKIEPIVVYQQKQGFVQFLNENVSSNSPGILQMLKSGVADTACIPYQKSKFHTADFDFSIPIYETQSSLMVNPKNLDDEYTDVLWSIFAPYSTTLWLCVGASLALQIFIASFVRLTEFRLGLQQKMNTFEVIWQMLRMQLSQSRGTDFYTYAGKLMTLIFALLQCFLILSLYQSWIVITRFNNRPAKSHQSVPYVLNMLTKGKLNFSLPHLNSWFYDEVRYSNISRFSMLKNASEHFIVQSNLEKSLDMIENNRFATIIMDDDPMTYLSMNRCSIVKLDQGMPVKTAHFAFPKGNPFRKLINEAIHHENIDIKRIKRLYDDVTTARKNRACSDVTEEEKTLKPLGVAAFGGLFIIYFVGFGFAFIVLFYERGNRLVVDH